MHKTDILSRLEEHAARPEDNKDITVALTRDNKIYLDGKESTTDKVQAVMNARALKAPDTTVILKADENIEIKRGVQIMDLAKQAGLPKVLLGTQILDKARAKT